MDPIPNGEDIAVDLGGADGNTLTQDQINGMAEYSFVEDVDAIADEQMDTPAPEGVPAGPVLIPDIAQFQKDVAVFQRQQAGRQLLDDQVDAIQSGFYHCPDQCGCGSSDRRYHFTCPDIADWKHCDPQE